MNSGARETATQRGNQGACPMADVGLMKADWNCSARTTIDFRSGTRRAPVLLPTWVPRALRDQCP